MELRLKVKQIYSELTDDDFHLYEGTIQIQNDSDGRGDYFVSWNHPTLTQPTQAKLDANGE